MDFGVTSYIGVGAASDVSGSVVYKEMNSPCIRFDATAEEVKTAIEAGAAANGLSPDCACDWLR